MQANKAQISELVIRPLRVHYHCRWDAETHPREYGELVSDLVDEIYRKELSPGDLERGMARFKSEWMKTRWPTQAELITVLMSVKTRYVGQSGGEGWKRRHASILEEMRERAVRAGTSIHFERPEA